MASRVLIVGHSGFIGQAILSTSTNIQFILSKNRINLKIKESCDLIVQEAIASNSKGVLNLAWQSNNTNDYDNLNNHTAWQEVTEYFARNAVKAGLKVYLVGTGEDNYPEKLNDYAMAKFKLKDSVRELITLGTVTWLRPFYIISVTESRPRLVRGLVNSKMSEFTIESPQSSNDYILVEDVATGIITTIENNLAGEIDIGSGILTSNSEIAEIICKMKDLPLPKTGSQPPKQGVIAKIEILENLNWKPTHTIAFLNKENYE